MVRNKVNSNSIAPDQIPNATTRPLRGLHKVITMRHEWLRRPGSKERRSYLRGDIVGDLAVAVSASALGVDDSLRDSLASEVSEFVQQVEVLSEDGAAGTGRHRVLVVVDGGARARRDRLSLYHE